MVFSEVREYAYGDDMRDIDWNVTARFGRPYVKVFEEERELTVMLLVDVSGSLDFGTASRTKRELTTEIAATIAFSALANNDKTGVIFFSDHIEKYIPPKKGRKHALYIIRELLELEPTSRKTDIGVGLDFLSQVMKRRCTAFLLSDFYAPQPYDNQLMMCNRKHDLGVIQVFDRRARELPNIGMMNVVDGETGKEMLIDTSDKKLRQAYQQYAANLQLQTLNTFAHAGVDYVSIATDDDYVKKLKRMFEQRRR